MSPQTPAGVNANQDVTTAAGAAGVDAAIDAANVPPITGACADALIAYQNARKIAGEGEYGVPDTLDARMRLLAQITCDLGLWDFFPLRETKNGKPFIQTTVPVTDNQGIQKTKGGVPLEDGGEPVFQGYTLDAAAAPTIVVHDEKGAEVTLYPKRMQFTIGAWNLSRSPQGGRKGKDALTVERSLSAMEAALKRNPALANDASVVSRLNTLRTAVGK